MMKTEGKGCKAQTGLTSVTVLLQCALAFNQAHRATYNAAIRLMMQEYENAPAIDSFESILQTIQKAVRPRVDDLFTLNST